MTSTLPRSQALWARLLVTLAVVVVYRLGVWIPLPTIDPERLQQLLEQLGCFPGGRLSAGLLSTSRSSTWGSPLI
jgi:preprotein translocase subunit SecY